MAGSPGRTALGLELVDASKDCDDRQLGVGGNGPLATDEPTASPPSLVPSDLDRDQRVDWLLERILTQLQQIAVLLAPPQNVKVLDQTLSEDGPVTLLPNLPTALGFWAIKNLGSNPILVWWVNTGSSIPATNFVTIGAGEYRAYATAPTSGVYAARTPGMSTDIEFEYWYS